jgi:pseudouridine-5'-phosphate glycosidase
VSRLFAISDLVACALEARRPVVALETTVVTHGLPHPEGVKMALEMEAEVLAGGAVPATIGILDGTIRVGLTRAELERLAEAPGDDGRPGDAGAGGGRRPRAAEKLNLSNLAAGIVSGAPGSTTVAATMLAAFRAGIEVFATGGIGGVHSDASETSDVSADLVALARLPVAVVCAGAKAVLDLKRTVEMLETLGVPVLGLGTDEFPAFYWRASGARVDRRFETVAEIAAAVRIHFALGIGTGVVVANPIPAEHELPAEPYERAVATVLAEAERAEVRGRALTPFLLERLRVLTEGRSVTSNRALLLHNARVAVGLARALVEAR